MFFRDRSFLLVFSAFLIGVLLSTAFFGIREYRGSIRSEIVSLSQDLRSRIYDLQMLQRYSGKNFERKLLSDIYVYGSELEQEFVLLDSIFFLESDRRYYSNLIESGVDDSKRILNDYQNKYPDIDLIKLLREETGVKSPKQ